MRNKILVLFLAIFLFGAFNETQLYSGLREKEANEILYILLSNNIECSKTSEKEGFTVMVDSTHMARAIRLLNSFGLPHAKFVNLGDVFAQQGLVASPMEEKARFIHAISQELSETISNIDGVLVARVHIVLPTENTVGEVLFPSSSSVFIKYQYGANVASLVPKIKLLVANSIEGLKERSVSVTLFEGDMVQLDLIPLQPVSYFWLYVVVGILGLSVVIGLAGLLWVWKSRTQSTRRLMETRVNPMQTVRARLRESGTPEQKPTQEAAAGDTAAQGGAEPTKPEGGGTKEGA